MPRAFFNHICRFGLAILKQYIHHRSPGLRGAISQPSWIGTSYTVSHAPLDFLTEAWLLSFKSHWSVLQIAAHLLMCVRKPFRMSVLAAPISLSPNLTAPACCQKGQNGKWCGLNPAQLFTSLHKRNRFTWFSVDSWLYCYAVREAHTSSHEQITAGR